MRTGPPENAILVAWQQTLARLGNAAAILSPNGQTLRSFDLIEDESRALEAMFAGYARREVIALQIGNEVSWPALLLALFRRELIPLPIGCHVESSELETVLAASQAGALVRSEGGALSLIHRGASPIAWNASLPDFLKLTSGTTSAPRVVRFRTSQLVADCDNICATMGLTSSDLNFGVIPFAHSYGFSNLITPLLCRGIPLVASDDRLPRAILEGLALTGATVFPGMPMFFQKLAELEKPPELPKLRLCISAGAPLPALAGEHFSARFGLKIHTFYGSSECGGIAYDASDELLYEDGFVGAPMRGVEISAEDDGRIAVRSAAVGDGYFPDDDPVALADGRFIPGDLVRSEARGMFIAGRASDVINVAGRKLNPAEIEHRLLECPGVRQASVFGVPSALRGEEAIACVAGEGIDARGVLRFCHERLSAWQVPRDIWIVPEIVANDRGKISRRLLAENYLAAQRNT